MESKCLFIDKILGPNPANFRCYPPDFSRSILMTTGYRIVPVFHPAKLCQITITNDLIIMRLTVLALSGRHCYLHTGITTL